MILGEYPKGIPFFFREGKGNLIIGLPKGSCVLSNMVESGAL